MKPFKIAGRDGWHGEVRQSDGRTTRRRFDKYAEAQTWMTQAQAQADAENAPAFGGPERITLAALLAQYAARFTIAKEGFNEEINRINHYLPQTDLQPLVVDVDAQGRRYLRHRTEPKVIPKGWQAHQDARLAKRKRTYAAIAKLGAARCSAISNDDIVQLKAVMRADGLSDSTIQKEIALLKHCFNQAISVWKWKTFENPCLGVKLGGSARRFIAVTAQEMDALVQALSECDNPQVWPLVELAIRSAMRRGSLLTLTWKHLDLEGRRAKIWAKGRWVVIPLSKRAVDTLRRVPRLHSERVFTLTENALDMAWDGVRIKAGVPRLQFRDLRHLAPTYYARLGATVTTLSQLLGHANTRMAEVYVNLAQSDVLAEMDRLDDDTSHGEPPLPPGL